MSPPVLVALFLAAIAAAAQASPLSDGKPMEFVPAQAVIECSGVNIAAWAFVPAGARGTLFFVHGYMSDSARFRGLLEGYAAQGWAIVGLDLPGHGESGGSRLAIASFHEYGDVVLAVLGHFGASLPRPLVGFGHSLGCLALVEASTREGPVPFDSLLLVAPLTRLALWPLSRAAAWAATPLGCLIKPLGALVSWVDALAAWRREAKSLESRDIKTVVIFSGLDTVVDGTDARGLLSAVFPKAIFVTVPGIGHWNLERRKPDARLLKEIGDFLDGAQNPP